LRLEIAREPYSFAIRVGCTVGMAEGLRLSGGTASRRCKSSGAFHGTIPRGRILEAIMVCSGETITWLGLIAGAVHATVEGKK
jgi:hypothetical protein